MGGYGIYYQTLAGDYSAIFSPSGFVTFPYSARSPIFYDSNNTGYYVDPESGSVLGGKLRLQSDSGGYGQFQINSSSTSIESTVVFGSGGSGQNSGQYTYAGVIGLGAYGNSKANLYFGAGYSSPAMYIPNNDANVYAINSFRAPIFYDSNNTAYFIDGAQICMNECINESMNE